MFTEHHFLWLVGGAINMAEHWHIEVFGGILINHMKFDSDPTIYLEVISFLFLVKLLKWPLRHSQTVNQI